MSMTVKPFNIPWLRIALVVCLAAFATLLALRLGWFDAGGPQPPPSVAADLVAEDVWMSIYQNEQKIGYSRRRFESAADGFRLADKTFLRIHAMGMVQDVNLDTTGHLKPDLSLAAFDFQLRSNLFAFVARGTIDGDILSVNIDGRKTEIPLDGPIYLTGAILRGLGSDDWVRDRPREFRIFDPTTLAQRPVTVTWIGQDTLEVMGRPTPARKLAVEFAGTRTLAWVDDKGQVVREEGLMGLSLRRSTPGEATAGLQDAPTADLTEVAAVALATPIQDPAGLRVLKLRVSGIPGGQALDGGRQAFADGVLTVRREAVPSPSAIDTGGQERHLAPSALIQSDHPEIRQTAQMITTAADLPLVKVRKLVAWVHENLEKRPVVSVPNAVEVLTRRMGDCNEHAVLLAALARAAGIPARVETGLVYSRGSFYYHAWNSVWLGAWVTVDALMNQIPADATHIRLVAPEAAGQIDLMGMIGKIRLEVLEQLRDG